MPPAKGGGKGKKPPGKGGGKDGAKAGGQGPPRQPRRVTFANDQQERPSSSRGRPVHSTNMNREDASSAGADGERYAFRAPDDQQTCPEDIHTLLQDTGACHPGTLVLVQLSDTGICTPALAAGPIASVSRFDDDVRACRACSAGSNLGMLSDEFKSELFRRCFVKSNVEATLAQRHTIWREFDPPYFRAYQQGSREDVRYRISRQGSLLLRHNPDGRMLIDSNGWGSLDQFMLQAYFGIRGLPPADICAESVILNPKNRSRLACVLTQQAGEYVVGRVPDPQHMRWFIKYHQGHSGGVQVAVSGRRLDASTWHNFPELHNAMPLHGCDYHD